MVVGQMRRLKQLHNIFTRGDNIVYCIYNPRSRKIHMKTGLSTKSSGRFVWYAISSGVHFLLVAVLKNKNRLYEMEEYMKSQICDPVAQRVTANLCRNPNSRWIEWFEFQSWNDVTQAIDNYVRKLQQEGLLVAARKWRGPDNNNTKLRMIQGRKAKKPKPFTNALKQINENLQVSEKATRGNQANNYVTALPVLETADSATLYIISDPADDEKEQKQQEPEDREDEKQGEAPAVPEYISQKRQGRHRFKFGYSFSMQERLVSYATSFPRGAKLHTLIMVPNDFDVISMEKALSKFIMDNGGIASDDNPYRETRSEWFYFNRDDLMQLMVEFSDLLDEDRVLLRSQIWIRGDGIYPNPARPNRVGIREARNQIRRQYRMRSGRVVRPVHEYKKGPKNQMENRLWDSIFAKRDYLKTTKRTTERLRESQENEELYNRAWGLIRTKWMNDGFDIDQFFINEMLIKEYLRIIHEILMDFHLKGNKRLAFFRKTLFYDSFDNKTLAERNAEYRQAELKHNEVTHLQWLKQRRDWRVIHFTLPTGRERLYLTSGTRRQFRNKVGAGDHRVLKLYQNEFYRNARAYTKTYLLRYPNIRTITRMVMDGPD